MNIFTTKNIIIFLVFVTIGVTVFFIIKNKNSDEEILENAAKLLGFKKIDGFENFTKNVNILLNFKDNAELIYDTYFKYFDRHNIKEKLISLLKNDWDENKMNDVIILLNQFIFYILLSNDSPSIEIEKSLLLFIGIANKLYESDQHEIKFRINNNKVILYFEDINNRCTTNTEGIYCETNTSNPSIDSNCVGFNIKPNNCVNINSNIFIKLVNEIYNSNSQSILFTDEHKNNLDKFCEFMSKKIDDFISGIL
jgi:hypothetical protein